MDDVQAKTISIQTHGVRVTPRYEVYAATGLALVLIAWIARRITKRLT
jgi:hypothetical protein